MKKIVIIGEHCTDKFIYCKVERLSPEAPVPILNPVSKTENEGMAGNVYQNIIAEIENLIKNSDIVIVSDYNKGFLDNGDLWNIAHLAKLSILDTKRKLTSDVASKFSFIKLNESESNNNKHLNFKNIIVTLGSKGATYNGELIPQNHPQQTIDVSGAGDTFVAAFALKFFETLEERPSIEYANEIASIVVSKRGVVTPY
jgi:bifunctional ADP-heptose synthase (sugar kinase/adenylyltransferase)